MNDFGNDLVQIIKSNILDQARKSDYINDRWNGTKINIPQSLLNECFSRIDMEVLKDHIVARLEQEVANKVVNKMVTEFSNDVKQIMSNVELREELRSILREKIKQAKCTLE